MRKERLYQGLVTKRKHSYQTNTNFFRSNVNLNQNRSKDAMEDFDSALRLEGVGMDDLMKIEKQKADRLKNLEHAHNIKMKERK